MKQSAGLLLTCGVLAASAPTAVHAHFRLLEPASWLIEGVRDDPQKAGPCGGTNTDYGKWVHTAKVDTPSELQITADPAKPIDKQWPAER